MFLSVWLLLLVLEVWHDAAVGNGVHGQAQDGVVAGLGQDLGHMALHGAFRQAQFGGNLLAALCLAHET